MSACGTGKLVRDKIRDLPGHPPNVAFHELAPVSIVSALFDKLREEVSELEEAETTEDFIEEMADVIEVLRALIHAKKIKLHSETQ